LLQYRFELSERQKSFAEHGDWYIVYKGAGPKGGILTEVECSVANVLMGKSLIVMSDCLPSKVSVKSDLDWRPTFSSLKESCGLIDLDYYGVRPLQRQDLTLLKEVVQSFLLNLPHRDAENGNERVHYNVLLAREHSCEVRSFLYLDTPIEKDQAVRLDYPQLSTLRQLIDKNSSRQCDFILAAIHALSGDDLMALLKFVAKDVISSRQENRNADTIVTAEDTESVKNDVSLYLRAYWLIRQCKALGVTSDFNEELPYTRKGLLTQFPQLEAEGMMSSVSESVIREFILDLIYNDTRNGERSRARWCKLANMLFNSLITTFVESFLKPELEAADIRMLFSKICHDAYKQELSYDLCTIRQLSIDDAENEEDIVVCKNITGENDIHIVIEEAKVQSLQLSRSWYNTQQYLIVKALLPYFSSMLDNDEFKLQEILLAVKPIVDDDDEEGDVQFDGTTSKLYGESQLRLLVRPSDATPVGYKPHTFQLFLGVVWPVLRRMQWKLIVDSDPNDIIFVSPGNKKQLQKRLREIQKVRDQKRAYLTQETIHLGYGVIPKLSKRLFVNTSLENGAIKVTREVKQASMDDIFENFKKYLQQGANPLSEDYERRTADIINQLSLLLRELVPALGAESHALPLDNPMQEAGVGAILQVLLVLPQLLQQSEISSEDTNDSLIVARELLAYVTQNYTEFLEERQHLPVEHYLTVERPKGLALKHKLRAVCSSLNPNGSETELTEAILEEDKHGLTDFVVTVLEQIVPCAATEEDARRKYRRVSLGYPGLMCRHCRGSNGEGRYFFSSLESVTTATTVFEKHINKCPLIPKEVKASVVSARTRHSEQRKSLVPGAQQAFFNRLWERLRSSNIGSNEEEVLSAKIEPTEKKAIASAPSSLSDDEGAQDAARIEFTNHVSVLDHIRTEEPWRDDSVILDALNQYYACVEFGSHVYNVGPPTEPLYYSSEWLLAKVVPKREKYKKPIIPG
jgi:hypothetical protein